jgi:hypothetical protein
VHDSEPLRELLRRQLVFVPADESSFHA